MLISFNVARGTESRSYMIPDSFMDLFACATVGPMCICCLHKKDCGGNDNKFAAETLAGLYLLLQEMFNDGNKNPKKGAV